MKLPKLTAVFVRSILTAFAFLVLAAQASPAQDPARIDEFINSEMQKQKIPGVSLAVVKDGKVMLAKGYGFSNVEHKVPVKPETVFQSGSVGKQFTAAAVMLLVEDGKISLDEKIGKYLGDVPGSWSNITVRHLLTHTSGMTGYPDDFDFRRDYTEDELLKRAKEIPLAFKPGEQWAYSNIGYLTLGVMVRKASGKFYGDFLQERIFKPFGMSTARVISESDIIPNRAAGYQLEKGELKNQHWVSPSLNTTADGALYLTALDMIKWDEALSGGKLFKKSSLDAMWSPVKLNDGRTQPYGFGWSFRTVNGRRVIEHGGAWQGFKAHIARFPDNNLTVIVFANLIQTDQVKLAHGVAGIVDPALVPKPIADPDPAFTADIRKLFESLLAGNADMSRFTPELQKAIAASNQRVVEMVKTLGTLEKFELLERTENPDGVQLRYRLTYTAMPLNLLVKVEKSGVVSGFGVRPE